MVYKSYNTEDLMNLLKNRSTKLSMVFPSIYADVLDLFSGHYRALTEYLPI